jgi:hypothetical protein
LAVVDETIQDCATRDAKLRLRVAVIRIRMMRGGRGADAPRAAVLTNQKGAVLELTGHQVELMANADLSGLAITMR